MSEHPKAVLYRKTMHVVDGKVVERWAFSDDTQAIIDFFARFG